MKKIHIVLPEKIGHIAPEVYGHFTELIGGVFYDGLWVGKDSDIPNIDGWRLEIVEKLRKIAPPVIRWPGGCFAETYDWRDGIGENRPTRVSWWTRNDGRYEKNEVGTHEFMRLCELVGAKPYFAANVTSATPRQILDWMDYCLSPRGTTELAKLREENGHAEPFDIPYWGVGNENWGGGGNMTPEYYALEYRRFATLMHDHFPQVDLIIGGANAKDYTWTQKICEAIVPKSIPAMGMSFHFYCGTAGEATDFTEDQWYELLEKAQEMEELIRRHYAVTDSLGITAKTKLVIDEWGPWHKEGSGPSKGEHLFEQQCTIRDALCSAITLNIFNNNAEKIKMANIAQMVNNIHCLFLSMGEKCVATPNYYVFDMFKGHMDADAVRTVVEENDDLKTRISASASVKDGVMTVTLGNYSAAEEAQVDLSVLGGKALGTATVRVLESDCLTAVNTFEDPEHIAPKETKVPVAALKSLVLPKASVVSVTVKVKEA